MARNTGRHSHRGVDTFTRITVMGLTILLLWGEVSRVEGGCSRFGHSCFGAHGKRAEIPAGYNVDSLAMVSPVGINQLGAPGGSVDAPSDSYDSNLIPLSSNTRISPYLLDWILSASARRMDSRQQASNPSADEMPTTYRRK